jgi:hypothetical protein
MLGWGHPWRWRWGSGRRRLVQSSNGPYPAHVGGVGERMASGRGRGGWRRDCRQKLWVMGRRVLHGKHLVISKGVHDVVPLSNCWPRPCIWPSGHTNSGIPLQWDGTGLIARGKSILVESCVVFLSDHFHICSHLAHSSWMIFLDIWWSKDKFHIFDTFV